MLNQGLGRVG